MLAGVVTKPLGVVTFEIYEDRLMNIIGKDEFRSKIIGLQSKQMSDSSKKGNGGKIVAATFQQQWFGNGKACFKREEPKIFWNCSGSHQFPSCDNQKSGEKEIGWLRIHEGAAEIVQRTCKEKGVW